MAWFKTRMLRKVWKKVAGQAEPRPAPIPLHACPDHGRTYGFDRVILVKGFGAIASGWQLIGRGRIQNMTLSAGDRTLELDRRCLVTVSRADLQGLASQPDLIWKAGFRAVLRGQTTGLLKTEPVLKLDLEGSVSKKLPIPFEVILQVEAPEAIGAIIDFFPSFANEPFLPAFAEAFAATMKGRAADALMVAAAKSRNVVVMVLPNHWDDLFLMMTAVFRFQAMLPPDVGLALMMSPEHPRVRVLDRFRELGFRSGRPMSLFEVNDSTFSLWSLAPALKQIGAERFLFCGPEVVLTEPGWEKAASYFRSNRARLELFLPGDTGEGAAPEPESLGFAWTTEAFVKWAGTAPFFFSGFHRDNHLPTDSGGGRHAGAISVLGARMPNEAIRRADERLYQAASAAKPPRSVPALSKPRAPITEPPKPQIPSTRTPRQGDAPPRAAAPGRASDVAGIVGGGAERSRVS